MRFRPAVVALSLALSSLVCAEMLPSNFLVGVASAGENALWSWSSEGKPGAALIELVDDAGLLRARSIRSAPPLDLLPSVPFFPRQLVDERLAGVASATIGERLFLPAYEDSKGGVPRLRGLFRLDRSSPGAQSEFLELFFPLDELPVDGLIALRTMAVRGDSLWISLGSAGIGLLSQPTSSSWNLKQISLDTTAKSWRVEQKCGDELPCAVPLTASVQTISWDASSGELLVEAGPKRYALLSDGTLSSREKGLPIEKGAIRLGSWSCGSQEWAQTVRKEKEQLQSTLWSKKGGDAWAKVSPASWDTLAVLLQRVECLGEEGWASLHSLESYRNGVLHLKGATLQQVEIPGQRALVSDLKAFEAADGSRWIAAATFGFGLALSADSGKSWNSVLNQADVKGDLREIRCIPSLMQRNGLSSRIAYRLSAKSRVTIEIFSYDMRRVKTVIRDETRPADPQRSSSAEFDLWDGRGEDGRYLSSGVYYVRVKDDRGHKGWGKIYKSAGAE